MSTFLSWFGGILFVLWFIGASVVHHDSKEKNYLRTIAITLNGILIVLIFAIGYIGGKL